MDIIFTLLSLFIFYLIIKWFFRKVGNVASNSSYKYSRYKDDKARRNEQKERDKTNAKEKAYRDETKAREDELKKRENDLKYQQEKADLASRERAFKYRFFFKGEDPKEKATNTLKDILKKMGL